MEVPFATREPSEIKVLVHSGMGITAPESRRVCRSYNSCFVCVGLCDYTYTFPFLSFPFLFFFFKTQKLKTPL